MHSLCERASDPETAWLSKSQRNAGPLNRDHIDGAFVDERIWIGLVDEDVIYCVPLEICHDTRMVLNNAMNGNLSERLVNSLTMRAVSVSVVPTDIGQSELSQLRQPGQYIVQACRCHAYSGAVFKGRKPT